MKVRMYGYNVPIQDPCVECGQPFKAGDSITLSPPRHRECDATAMLLDDVLRHDFEALSRDLDRQTGDAS